MRNALLIAIGTIVFLLLAAFIVPMLIPVAKYQGIVERSIQERLDARVALQKLTFRLLPLPGYTIEGFSLISTRPPFKGLSILQAKKVKGSLSLLSLMRGKIETSVELRDVAFDVRLEEEGSNLGMMLGYAAMSGQGEGSSSSSAIGLTPRTPEGGAGAIHSPPADPSGIKALPAPSIDLKAPEPKPPASPHPGGQEEGSALEGAFLRTAHAEAQTDGMASPVSKRLRIEKLRIVRGTITVYPRGDLPPFSIKRVSVSAKPLQQGTEAALDLRLSGIFGEAERTNLRCSGTFTLDGSRRKLFGRKLMLAFNGSQFAGEVTVDYNMVPLFFDLHAATPDLRPQALQPLLGAFGTALPLGLAWQGSAALDLTLKGTLDAADILLQLDATQARLTARGRTLKETGLGLKASSRLILDQGAIELEKNLLTIGGDEILLSGRIARDDDASAALELSGSGLGPSTTKLFLPWLSLADDVEGVSLEMTARGLLFGEEPMALEGSLSASRISVDGVEVREISFAFERDRQDLSIPTFKGTFADGAVSGNGSIHQDESMSMEFDAVVDDADLAKIASLRGALAGTGSIVVTLKGDGYKPSGGMPHLSLGGTLVVAKGTISNADVVLAALGNETWDALQRMTGMELGQKGRADLASAGEAFSDLMAAFEERRNAISVSELTWKHPLYAAKLTANVSAAGAFEADGELVLAPEPAAALITDATMRRSLLDHKGALPLPVRGRGSLSLPRLEVNASRLRELAAKLIPEGGPQAAEKQEEAEAEVKAEVEGAKESHVPLPQKVPEEKPQAEIKAKAESKTIVLPKAPEKKVAPETSPEERASEQQEISPSSVPLESLKGISAEPLPEEGREKDEAAGKALTQEPTAGVPQAKPEVPPVTTEEEPAAETAAPQEPREEEPVLETLLPEIPALGEAESEKAVPKVPVEEKPVEPATSIEKAPQAEPAVKAVSPEAPKARIAEEPSMPAEAEQKEVSEKPKLQVQEPQKAPEKVEAPTSAKPEEALPKPASAPSEKPAEKKKSTAAPPKPKRKRKPKTQTRTPNQPVEDVLKVIIGD